MNCAVCGDLGMLIHEWTDAPHDFAVCLCAGGQRYRSRAMVPLWCAVHRVEPSRVFLLEDIYTAAELAAAGFTANNATPVSREAALLAHGRKAKGKP